MTTSTTKSPSSEDWWETCTPEETLAIWRSGVARWHANRWPSLRGSGDTTDAHQGRCVRLLLCLHPNPSVPLLAATACHDVQECVTGDVPGPAKQGQFGKELAFFEAKVAVEMGLPAVFGREGRWLKLVDMLDAHLWASLIEPRIRDDPEWIAFGQQIINAAEDLGCDEVVAAMLERPPG